MPFFRPRCIPNPSAIPTVLRLPTAIRDNRFHAIEKERYFICDNMRCRRIARFNSQELPFDGQYEKYDGSLPCASLHALWEDGCNFMWCCTPCHAERLCLSSSVADLDHARILVCLRFHPYLSETDDRMAWHMTRHLRTWRLLTASSHRMLLSRL